MRNPAVKMRKICYCTKHFPYLPEVESMPPTDHSKYKQDLKSIWNTFTAACNKAKKKYKKQYFVRAIPVVRTRKKALNTSLKFAPITQSCTIFI